MGLLEFIKYTGSVFIVIMSIPRSLVTSFFIPPSKVRWIHRAISQPRKACIIPLYRPLGQASKTIRCLSSASSHSGFSAKEFIPPIPPTFTGAAVFADVDISPSENSTAKQLALTRNMDPEAVFVVSGASRGIGLRTVEALQQRTKVTVSFILECLAHSCHLTDSTISII